MGKRIEIPEDKYLTGLKEANERLQEAIDQLERGSAQGLANAAFRIATEAQQRAPVETGDLRGSVFVDLDGDQYAMGSENGKSVEITGKVPEGATKALIGFNCPYAADQHEHTEYSHPSMERIRKMRSGGATDLSFMGSENGQAKYLESVLVEQSDTLLQIIAAAIGGD